MVNSLNAHVLIILKLLFLKLLFKLAMIHSLSKSAMIYLCSNYHISVVADAVVRYLPSGDVIKYIIQSDVGDTRGNTLPTSVGICLFQVMDAVASAYAYDRFGRFCERFYVDSPYVYVETVQPLGDIDLFKAVSEFCALYDFACNFYVGHIDVTDELLSSLMRKLIEKTRNMPQELFDSEYEKAASWLNDTVLCESHSFFYDTMYEYDSPF